MPPLRIETDDGKGIWRHISDIQPGERYRAFTDFRFDGVMRKYLYGVDRVQNQGVILYASGGMAVTMATKLDPEREDIFPDNVTQVARLDEGQSHEVSIFSPSGEPMAVRFTYVAKD